MQDQLLKCKNCDNPFVYSVYEQIADQKKSTTKDLPSTIYDLKSMTPVYCPICTSIKASEAKRPPKPQKNPA